MKNLINRIRGVERDVVQAPVEGEAPCQKRFSLEAKSARLHDRASVASTDFPE
ncbi:MAG: hypothetical protein P8009_07030 [Gammaproteobacteria bacterium]